MPLRRWIAIGLWVVTAIVIIDTGISLALTCQGQAYPVEQNPIRDCSVFHGPLFRFLIWFSDAFDRPGEAVIALFTIVLAISMIGLWRSTNKLWKAGEKQLSIAAYAAHSSERSARAAQQAAAIMDETAERQLRAYVMVDSAQAERLMLGQKPKAKVSIKNSGQTPAYELTHWCSLGLSSYPLTGEVPNSKDSGEALPPRPLAPGGVLHTWADEERELNEATVTALRAGTHALYVIGQIRYVDAFGEKRETDFLLFAGGPIGISGELASYTTGNRAT